MRNYEMRMAQPANTKSWDVAVYDPNIGTQIAQVRKNFASVGEAEVWAEIWGSVTKSFELESGHIVRAEIPYEGTDLSKLLDTTSA